MKSPDKFYMGIAYEISSASYAKRRKVGTILVKDNNIISFGYNGTPKGFSNVCEDGNSTKPEVLHAESNAIAKCAQSTMNSAGSTMYSTCAPCFDCAKLIIQAGITKVYYLEDYRDNKGLELLDAAKILTVKITL